MGHYLLPPPLKCLPLPKHTHEMEIAPFSRQHFSPPLPRGTGWQGGRGCVWQVHPAQSTKFTDFEADCAGVAKLCEIQVCLEGALSTPPPATWRQVAREERGGCKVKVHPARSTKFADFEADCAGVAENMMQVCLESALSTTHSLTHTHTHTHSGFCEGSVLVW